MALGIWKAKKQKRTRKVPGFQFSVSLDIQTVQELTNWMLEKEMDRSEAVRYLILQGLMYETIIKPENVRRAKEESERVVQNEQPQKDSNNKPDFEIR